MTNLTGKVALISGAARGQGATEARLFVESGASVVIGDILEDAGQQLAEELGEQALFVNLDVTRSEAWKLAVDTAVKQFGKLDILVNNAGISITGLIEEQPEDDYLRVIRVNQLGPYLGMQAAIPAMRANGGGSIVNISSNTALRGAVNTNAYTSSKWAVRGMTKTAALELGKDGIRVNSVHPGVVDTALVNWQQYSEEQRQAVVGGFAISRIGTPLEIAKMVAFLASDDSSYCTGAEFVVDGGATAGVAQSAFQH